MFDPLLIEKAQELVGDCRTNAIMLATAESCTGGLVSALITEIPGSSKVLERSFVTYSNNAKEQMLGVPPEWFGEYGAVSEPVAFAMAEGALRHSRAHMALSCTGIAGPGGGTKSKPVGTVFIACSAEGLETDVKGYHFDGDRHTIRMASVHAMLDLALSKLG